jgi:hypothetical protein
MYTTYLISFHLNFVPEISSQSHFWAADGRVDVNFQNFVGFRRLETTRRHGQKDAKARQATKASRARLSAAAKAKKR